VHPVLSRELKSLQEELSASQRERLSPPASLSEDRTAAAGAKPVPAAPPQEAAEEQYMREQLGDLVSDVEKFFEEAEKNISAHPIESVVGALLVASFRRLRQEEITGEIIELSAGSISAAAPVKRKRNRASALSS